MASTEQKRKWYPEVVINHADRGQAGYTPECDPQRYAVRHTFPREGGGEWYLWVHPLTVEAWDAYEFLMYRHGETVPRDGGTHNCRNIAGTSWPSLHAYCVCIDIPPNHRKSVAFQRDVLAIKTNSGVRVFKNLASSNDRMHDEIDCSPADLASGIDWNTVAGSGGTPPNREDDDMLGFVVGKVGDAAIPFSERAVELQLMLVDRGQNPGKIDGWIGDNTRNALIAYQKAVGIGLPELGAAKIGPYTSSRFKRGITTAPAGALTKAEADKAYAPKTHSHTATVTAAVTVK